MNIKEILTPKAVLMDPEITTKEQLFKEMSAFICSIFSLEYESLIYSKLVERENEISTGLGFGVAIPHARISTVENPVMAAAKLSDGIEYEGALDGKPVNLVFMLISNPSMPDVHKDILSGLSTILSYETVRTNLVKAKDSSEFIDILISSYEKYE